MKTADRYLLLAKVLKKASADIDLNRVLAPDPIKYILAEAADRIQSITEEAFDLNKDKDDPQYGAPRHSSKKVK